MLVVASGIWAYGTSFRGVLALDDVRAIVRNETIRTVWPLSVPLSPPPASTVAGRPVANLSFALNYALAPLWPAGSQPLSAGPEGPGFSPAAPPPDPAPFHAGNLLVHVLAALLLLGVVRRTLRAPPLEADYGDAAPWLALTVALIWVVHPLTTSAVTYVVQRVESLMGLFYLLTLYCSIRVSEGQRANSWAAAAIAACALGMATKEVTVTAPLMVAVWWRLFGSARPGAPRWPGRMLLVGLAATWAVIALLVSGERRGPSLDLAWNSVWAYLLAQAEVVVHYMRLAVVPSPLVFLYDWPLRTSLVAVAWQAGLLTLLVALTAVGVWRRHPASVLGAWFFLVLAPSSSVLPIITEVAAEHRMYLPLAAIATAIVMSAFVAGRKLLPSTWTRAAAVLALLAIVLLLGAETRDRNRVYWSSVGLWADTVAKRPNDARPRVAYGEALAEAGRLWEAQSQLEAAIALNPDDAAARLRMAVVLARLGRLPEALPHAERAAALRPGDPDARRLRTELLRAMQAAR